MTTIAERHAAKREAASKARTEDLANDPLVKKSMAIYHSATKQERIWRKILAERVRQNEIHPDKNCAMPHVSSGYKGLVLVEEVGECAKEGMIIMDTPRTDPEHQAAREKLKTELVQVAATAVAWLESLEGES